eukprot:1153582-Pelagomonas_calceolata.AAC.1
MHARARTLELNIPANRVPLRLKAMHDAAPCSRYSSIISGSCTLWNGSAGRGNGSIEAFSSVKMPTHLHAEPHTSDDSRKVVIGLT